MDIMELGAIGELVGGVAVIATLIYLALQIRQNTNLAQGTAQRELMDSFQANIDRVAQDPATWQEGCRSFETLSNEEQLRFAAMFNPWINQLEQVLRMGRRGLEAEDNIENYGNVCLSMVQEPGALEVWNRSKHLFFPMSRDYIETRLENSRDLPPRLSEVLPWWGPGSTSSGPRM